MNTDFPLTAPVNYGLYIGAASSNVGYVELYGSRIKVVTSSSVPPGTIYMMTDPDGSGDIVVTRSDKQEPPKYTPPPKRNLLID